MEILNKPIKKADLLNCANWMETIDGTMVKAVVDINREILGIDSELHADIEQAFLNSGSEQDDIWGINLYPEKEGDEMVEFDSMINIRPRMHNRTRYVEDEEIRAKIIEVVRKWVE